jgi:hypothetical protein
MAPPDDNPRQRDRDRPLRVLVRHSGSSKDTELAEELLAHLRPFERFAGIDVWSDDRIRAGDETRAEVDAAIENADVAGVPVLAPKCDWPSSHDVAHVHDEHHHSQQGQTHHGLFTRTQDGEHIKLVES